MWAESLYDNYSDGSGNAPRVISGKYAPASAITTIATCPKKEKMEYNLNKVAARWYIYGAPYQIADYVDYAGARALKALTYKLDKVPMMDKKTGIKHVLLSEAAQAAGSISEGGMETQSDLCGAAPREISKCIDAGRACSGSQQE